MKIYDTAGNELDRDEIDFSQGRLLQGDEEETLVFYTWEEKPAEDESGNPIDVNAPTTEERIAAMESAIEELMML